MPKNTPSRAGQKSNGRALPRAGIDPAALASELLAALRGDKRSRPGFSRYLGYASNIAQRWETGLAWPSAHTFFLICARLRIDVPAALRAFLRRDAPWLRDASADTLPAELLSELRGRTRLAAVVERTPYHRSSVSRWLDGSRQPKLPELLCLIEALSGRSLDFVASFVDPRRLPSIARRWEELVLARELAYEHPLSHAVLRALELDAYRAGGYRDPEFLPRALGMSGTDVDRALALLEQSGQVRKTRRGFQAQPRVVDTGADPDRARGIKLGWAEFAVQRLRGGAPGQSGYNLFAISRADLRRLHEIQLAFVREMQTVIASSKSNECVALYCSQLIDLGASGPNAGLRQRPGGDR
jgi:hypothetical protein